ncbi:uncharacterized protein LOC111060957 [Nilaparvata lugens]|uniref:uncharacterized protein LOC111060957 n=1 Tax=Nilaparvata lugens TaxID=108931 RepID=UPI00193E0172|nr:uncharacterized protein LOC111060957 [Nilaparvata lugens]XP_039283316.1 uncharacterized protein LOC111060957 [Nilaparvata lugens]XP_039283317.1 uncharacterized protein LOC111060957 [Nilaparvata lugens]
MGAIAHHQPWSCCPLLLSVPLMATLVAARGLPTVDPGLFVISGVGTCGGGGGYCLLGFDCTLDEDFVADDGNGHCEGLKSAFTPSAHFVCCQDTKRPSSSNNQTKMEQSLINLIAAVNNDVGMDMKNKRKPINELKEEGKNGDNLEKTTIPPSPTTTESLEVQSTTDTTPLDKTDQPDVLDKINSIVEQSNDQIQKDKMEPDEDSNYVDKPEMSQKEANDEEVEDALKKLIASVNTIYEMDKKYFKKPLSGLVEGETNDDQEITTDGVMSTKSEPIIEQSTTDVTPQDIETTESPDVPDLQDDIDKINSVLGQAMDEEELGGASIESKDSWMGQASDEHKVYESPWSDRNKQWYTSSEEPPKDEANEVVESGMIDVKSQQTSTQTPPADWNLSITTSPDDTQTYMTSHDMESYSETPAIKSHLDIESNQVHPASNAVTEASNQSVTSENATATTELQTELPPCGMSARCISLVKFMYNDNVLCYGSPLYWDWTVTSASCALRIFRKGMFNVSVSPEGSDSWSMGGSVRTIIVHESFRAVENPLHLEVNNIGLIRLYPGLGWNLCRECLPRADQEFQGDRCATHPLSHSNSRYYHHSRGASDVCEGVTELLPGVGSFLALPCPTSSWSPRSTGSSSGTMGLPLRCDGVLAGVQAAEGVGTRVYTPITPYLQWIDSNVRKGPVPRQGFRNQF